MTYRIIFRVPESLTEQALTPEQMQAILRVFGQYVMPMPNTQNAEGMKLIDAVTNDNFTPEGMGALGLNWQIIGMWDESCNPLVTFNSTDMQKHVVGDLVEPHKWAGWGACF